MRGRCLIALLILAACQASAAVPSHAVAKGETGLPDVSRGLLQQVADRAARRASGARAPSTSPVRADVVLDSGAPMSRADLAGTGVRVLALSRRHGRATVVVPDRQALERLSMLDGVRMVNEDFGYTRRAGAVTSRAVEVLNVDAINADTPKGLDGADITIGILSDSISRTNDVVDGGTGFTNGIDAGDTGAKSDTLMTDSIPQRSGDLPESIRIVQDDDTSSSSLVDEGAAMAELIHDIAPGAAIAFHTATAGGIAGFAEAIDTLCAAGSGVDVVVDDIGYLAELMYQRDPISRAAEACVARGVPFFSAAGNIGQRGFRAEFDDLSGIDDSGRSTVLPVRDNDFHDWDGGDPYLRVRVPSGANATAVLQWNQPALSVPENDVNGPRIDLDLLVFASPSTGSVLDATSSVRDQKADTAADGEDPVELVELSGGKTYYLAVDHWAGAQERIPQDDGTRLEFRLVFYERGGSSTIEYLDTAGGLSAAPTMYGHPVADGVIGVGAVPWYDAPPYRDATNDIGDDGRITPQPYSSLGGALERHFRPDGRFRRGTQAPQPAIAATDGHNTTFFGQDWSETALADEGGADGEDDAYPNFFGTSAAAPNAAAVAALLLEANDLLSPAELAGKLQASALDVTGDAASAGCDDVTGSGLIDAEAALSVTAEAPVARAGRDQSADAGDTVTLDGSRSSDDVAVDGYRWRQVGGARVSLTNAGGAQAEVRVPDAASTLVFELRVRDAACLSDADRVSVDVAGDGDGGGGAAAPTSLFLLCLGSLLQMCRSARRDGIMGPRRL